MKRMAAALLALASGCAAAAQLQLVKDINRTIPIASATDFEAATPAAAGSAWIAGSCIGYACNTVAVDTVSGQAITLLANGSSSAGGPNATLGSTGYFFSDSKLYATDGTRAGTTVVVDTGQYYGFRNLRTTSSLLFFNSGSSLWRSDGTSAGTFAVTSGRSSVSPVTVGNRLVFVQGGVYYSGTYELWASDGTAAGTQMIHDFEGALPYPLEKVPFVAGNLAYVWRDAANGGFDLWATDGTSAGTYFVGNLARRWNVDSGPYLDMKMGAAGSVFVTALFDAYTSGGTVFIYASDGTVANPAAVMSWPAAHLADMVSAGAYVYVNLHVGTESQVWRSDGTAAGTVRIDGGGLQVQEMVAVGVDVYARTKASDTSPSVLWRFPGDNSAPTSYAMPSEATLKGTMGGYLLLRHTMGFDLSAPTAAWLFDPAGGFRAIQAAPGEMSNGSMCGRPGAVLNGKLLFPAEDGLHDCSLWVTDGTEGGTQMVAQAPLRLHGNEQPPNFTTIGGYTYFSGTDVPATFWRTDGTAAGTTKLLTFDGAGGASFAPLGNDVFAVYRSNAWVVSGADGSARQVLPSVSASYQYLGPPVAFGNAVLFSASTATETRLLKYDGTTFTDLGHVQDGAGYGVLIFPGNGVALIQGYINHALRLLRTDGTPAGTYELTALTVSSSTMPVGGPFAGRFFYKNGTSTFSTDGSSAGIPVQADFSYFASDATAGYLVSGGSLPDLWRLRPDGSPMSYVPFDAWAGQWPIVSHSTLFMIAGGSLYASGGTFEGTMPIAGAHVVDAYGAGPLETPFGIFVFAGEPYLLPFDGDPDPATVPAASNVSPDRPAISSAVQVQGIDIAVPVTTTGGDVCVSSGNHCTCDLVPYAQSVMVNFGQYLCFREPPSPTALGTATMQASIGGQSATFTATTSSETNYALAAHGGVATASSQLSPSFPIAAVNDNERAGASWTNGGGWADSTFGAYPDWVEIDFDAPKLIDKVVLYTVQDDWQNPIEPYDTQTFTQYGVTDFQVQAWDGGAWVTLATVAGNRLVKSTVTFTAFNTNRIRISVTGALASLSRITEIEAWGVPGPPMEFNFAAAAMGAYAVPSSELGADFPAIAAIDGERAGVNWTRGGGWADASLNTYPDSLQVVFNGTKTIDRVVVYSVQDDWQHPVTPTDTMTFTQYGIVDFDVLVHGENGWVTIATVTGNNLVKRSVTFNPVTTDRVMVLVHNALTFLSRIVELEAWGINSGSIANNVALASVGGIASASSTLSADYPVQAIIDGDRTGAGWSAGGGWADQTPGTYPDWVQVDLPAPHVLEKAVVYSVQDDWQHPVTPTDTMTFTQWGVQDFTVQAWDGTQWVTVGSVTGNNLVKRVVRFTPVVTTKLRVSITRSLNDFSRIAELEVYGVPQSGADSNNVALANAGTVATASSQLSAAFPATAVIDGERAGASWGNGGGWADGTLNAFPDWLQLTFKGGKTIDRVVVYGVQDDWQHPVDPSDTMTFTQYGLVDFDVQALYGGNWITVARVTGNNLVKRKVSFAPIYATAMRISVRNALSSLSRITEVEAYGY